MKRTFGITISLAALAVAQSAAAQDQSAANTGAAQVQDVIVTAQKRSERLQDVPIAVTAITAETIQNRRTLDLVDLSNQAPGLQIKSDDNGANPRIFIRGVGVNDFNPATNSAVGIYADGVYVASPLAQRLAFFDLQQVEVLRGPQGTLYGRNTTGGAINVTSKLPGNEMEADLSAEYGRFNSVNVQGGASVPLIADKLSVRIAGLYQRDDGYTLNRLTGHYGNNTNRWAVRGTVHFTPSANVTDNLVVSTGRSTGGSIWAYNRPLLTEPYQSDSFCAPALYGTAQCMTFMGYTNPSKNLYQGDYSFEGKDRVNLLTVSNTLTIDLGAASIVSVTGYQHASRNDQEDTDASPIPTITASYIARQNTFSQELRLQSNGHTPLRYVIGAYYAHDYLNNNSAYNVLPLLASDDPVADAGQGIGVFGWPLMQKVDSYAAFGQLDYDLTARLTLTGGLRYSADHKDFHYVSEAANGLVPIFTYDGAKTFSSFTGKVGVQYRLTPSANIYASYNRGAKSGGFFSGQATDPADIGPYKDETVNAYEVGAKTDWLNHTLRANISAFYYDYKNLQVYTTVIDPPFTRQLFTNASAARIYGGELELQATPTRGLTVSLNTAYLNATYRDFKSAGNDYSGNTLPSAPKVSVQGAVDWQHETPLGTLVANTSLSFRSKVFFDTSNDARLTDQARAFVDARLGIRVARDRLEIGVWGKNVFNETNISDMTPIPTLGFDVFSVGPPRTYGLYLKARY
ncbi:TonB-dependent receptor [Sphingomonas sp. CL5.1]|uniref:TonB-dependent receptor n=1 Tax=Sphingomonas sp. CL5.1 TaxID=2653203 RepID=UPI0015826F60|nr:TonB-dependent receptor [Sphingomonas sp. CL5.1]QKS01689.1 TonB-dependent receptor [Sphingomonas sp. CL5.1]